MMAFREPILFTYKCWGNVSGWGGSGGRQPHHLPQTRRPARIYERDDKGDEGGIV